MNTTEDGVYIGDECLYLAQMCHFISVDNEQNGKLSLIAHKKLNRKLSAIISWVGIKQILHKDVGIWSGSTPQNLVYSIQQQQQQQQQ